MNTNLKNQRLWRITLVILAIYTILLIVNVPWTLLSNARIHTGKKMRERIQAWRHRGLFVFYLPTYSPHLNIAETLWRKLKYEWLSAEDYKSKGHLQYAVRQAISAFGKSLKIRFSGFKHSSVYL